MGFWAWLPKAVELFHTAPYPFLLVPTDISECHQQEVTDISLSNENLDPMLKDITFRQALSHSWMKDWASSFPGKKRNVFSFSAVSVEGHKTAEHINKELTQRRFSLITETFFVVFDYRNILQHLVTKGSFFRAKFSSPSLLPPKNISQKVKTLPSLPKGFFIK